MICHRIWTSLDDLPAVFEAPCGPAPPHLTGHLSSTGPHARCSPQAETDPLGAFARAAPSAGTRLVLSLHYGIHLYKRMMSAINLYQGWMEEIMELMKFTFKSPIIFTYRTLHFHMVPTS